MLITYVKDSVHVGVECLGDKAECGQVVEKVRQESARSRVCVRAADYHIVHGVRAAEAILQLAHHRPLHRISHHSRVEADESDPRLLLILDDKCPRELAQVDALAFLRQLCVAHLRGEWRRRGRT